MQESLSKTNMHGGQLEILLPWTREFQEQPKNIWKRWRHDPSSGFWKGRTELLLSPQTPTLQNGVWPERLCPKPPVCALGPGGSSKWAEWPSRETVEGKCVAPCLAQNGHTDVLLETSCSSSVKAAFAEPLPWVLLGHLNIMASITLATVPWQRESCQSPPCYTESGEVNREPSRKCSLSVTTRLKNLTSQYCNVLLKHLLSEYIRWMLDPILKHSSLIQWHPVDC